jgi:hypothetical protein
MITERLRKLVAQDCQESAPRDIDALRAQLEARVYQHGPFYRQRMAFRHLQERRQDRVGLELWITEFLLNTVQEGGEHVWLREDFARTIAEHLDTDDGEGMSAAFAQLPMPTRKGLVLLSRALPIQLHPPTEHELAHALTKPGGKLVMWLRSVEPRTKFLQAMETSQ